MAGLVYCRYCDYSTSARLMAAHEETCEHNPNRVEHPIVRPLPPGHVSADHYLRQFDNGPEGAPRLQAMAAHCAYLYNLLQDERDLRLETCRDIVKKLAEASPLTALALSLEEAAREMEDD